MSHKHDPQTRLASIREAMYAAHNDWDQLTKLWSIQNDIEWLLSIAEEARQAVDAAGSESWPVNCDRLRAALEPPETP